MAGLERFELNHTGIREYLLSGDTYPALVPVASRIAARAKSLASGHIRTGRYAAGVTGPQRERSTGRNGRVRVRVYATDPKSAILESRYHVMGRAIG